MTAMRSPIASPALDVARLYRARQGVVDLVEVPELLFVSVEGQGPPAGPAFAEALGALYPVAYGVRFALRTVGIDEKVSPLEALWWTPDPAGDFSRALMAGGFDEADMERWRWRALIRLPAGTPGELVADVEEALLARHPELDESLARVRFGPWHEGRCAQTLHVGPYADELATVELLHGALADAGYRPGGLHHEIYLGDPRRSAPERLRTILRQPVVPA
jgi:hypothetical protein